MGFNNDRWLGNYQVLTATAIAAEKSYIWCMLVWGATLERNDIRISVDEIYDPMLGKVFEAIKAIYDEGWHPDLVQVANWLQNKWWWAPKVSGMNNIYLSDICCWDFSYHNLRKYESLVKEWSRKIRAQKIVDKVLDDTERSASSLLKYWQELIEIATNSMGNWARWFDIAHAHWLANKIAELDGKDLHGYSFGSEFKFLDFNTKWIQKGKSYRIGAPSNTWKTQFAYSIINNLIAQWARVMFLTLENETQTTLGYLMSQYQGYSMDSILKWESTWDFDYLVSIKDKLAIVEDSFYLWDIFSRIMEFKPDVVILDYIGLASIKGFTEEQKYTEYAIQVQRFVKQMQVAWIDLSNLPTSLQQADEIRMNPQFYGSTFLRNNTDVWIHIMPWKKFYEVREAVMTWDIYNIESKNKMRKLSWITLVLSKNRLWPHSIYANYIIDFTKWAKFEEYSQEEFARLSSKYWM